MVEIADEVVLLAQQGDPDAFRSILEAFEKPVFQTVYRMVGGRFPNDVEDVTQDVFLKVFRSLGRFDAGRGVKFSTWVYAFVKNHCFDVLKKRRLNLVSLDAAMDKDENQASEVEATTRPAEGEALALELDRHIQEAVASLPDDQRLVFVLREYEGLDYREISEVAGCSEGTVKSRLYRAKEALRGSLKNYVLQ
ncbi:MAG: sigma-70 family RNA polymerase sigma factor [Planctomycetes bacterium]|nr:sigma-70 family RNA polymerase sigma factor [Planctomycetota bacterium]